MVRSQYRPSGQSSVAAGISHPVKRWMAASLNGMVEAVGAVFEAESMLAMGEEPRRNIWLSFSGYRLPGCHSVDYHRRQIGSK